MPLDFPTGSSQDFGLQKPKVKAMPAQRLPTKPRRRDIRSAAANSAGVQLNLVLKAIETERDNLSRADSLLGCLSIAMEYGEMDHKGPYYPDVAQIARQMIRTSIRALDPINFPDASRDKVKEDLARNNFSPLVVALHLRVVPRQILTPARRSSLRIHRRNYSRSLASAASSKDSASANISG